MAENTIKRILERGPSRTIQTKIRDGVTVPKCTQYTIQILYIKQLYRNIQYLKTDLRHYAIFISILRFLHVAFFFFFLFTCSKKLK